MPALLRRRRRRHASAPRPPGCSSASPPPASARSTTSSTSPTTCCSSSGTRCTRSTSSGSAGTTAHPHGADRASADDARRPGAHADRRHARHRRRDARAGDRRRDGRRRQRGVRRDPDHRARERLVRADRHPAHEQAPRPVDRSVVPLRARRRLRGAARRRWRVRARCSRRPARARCAARLGRCVSRTARSAGIVRLDTARVAQVLGADVPVVEITRTLEGLGFACRRRRGRRDRRSARWPGPARGAVPRRDRPVLAHRRVARCRPHRRNRAPLRLRPPADDVPGARRHARRTGSPARTRPAGAAPGRGRRLRRGRDVLVHRARRRR